MEIWDIYDEDRKKTGRTQIRGVPLAPGDWHLSVGIILLNSKDEIFCTLRSQKKATLPGRWECTQGACITGEDSFTAARRELLEETGLSAPELTLIYQDKLPQYKLLMDVYAARLDFSLDSVVLQPGETDAAAFLPYGEWERRMKADGLVFPIRRAPSFFEAVRRFRDTAGRIVRYPQEDSSETLREEILKLQDFAWSGSSAEGDWPDTAVHAASFCSFQEGRLAAHAAVQRKVMTHRGQDYLAFGLCEVVTHPDYRGKGLALELIRSAAAYLRAQSADLSVFTCDPSLVPFYVQGGWEYRPDCTLVGGSKEQPFRSDGEGLAVMLQLISERAKAHADDFTNTDITIELGNRKLW